MEMRVVRRTDRFDETCRFYGELLGWPVTRQWDADDQQGRGRIFGYGDVGRVEVIETTEPAAVSGVFLAFEHGGVQALHDRLVAAGVEVTQPVAMQPWGHRNVGVVDPAGVTVVFYEWA